MAVPLPRVMRNQHGVALITALLVVALATVAAVAMAARQQLDVRRTANLLDGDQAYAYALAVESWGRVALARDAGENQVDRLDESWAQRLSPIAVPGGQVDGFVSDLQGRFNLNNLLDTSGLQPSEPDVEYFKRLLRALELDEQLAGAVLDWVDPDFQVRFDADGAEDEYYLSTTTPYRAANRNFQSISELRLVKGVTAEIWNTLAPYVCALPARTLLNVNTAQAPLLQALAAEFTASDAEQLITARGDSGYDSVADFLQQEVFAGREIEQNLLGVTSSYFLIRAEINVGTARTQLYSVVQRQNATLRTLARTQGTW